VTRRPQPGAVLVSGGLAVRRLILVGATQHGGVLVDDGGRTGTGGCLRHRVLGAGARRTVLDGRDILDNAATKVAVDLGHGPTLPSGAGVPYHSLPTPEKASGTFRPRLD